MTAKTSRQSTDLFHLIVENVRDFAVFMTDTDGRIVSWNPGVERLLGYKEEEFLGQHSSIIFTPEDRERGEHVREMRIAADEGKAEDKRWHLRKDGSRFWADGKLMLLKDEQGGIHGFAKIIRDDTEHKHFEERLRASEERFRSAFAHARVGLAITDLQMRFLQVNQAYCDITGYTGQELHALDFISITHLEDRPEKLQKVAEMLKGELPGFTIEKRYIRKDGQNVWVENSLSVARDEQGRPQNIIIIVQDISRRKLAEAEKERLLAQLANERSRLEQILQQMPAGVSIIEAPSGRLIFHNDEAVRLLRHPMADSSDFTAYAGYGGLHADGRRYEADEYPTVRALHKMETVHGEEMLYRRGDGTTTVFSVNSSPIRDRDGKVVAAVTVFHDVSDQKRALEERESLLRQLEAERARLEYLFRQAPAFVATLSGPEHVFELTNPSYLQLIGHRNVIGKPAREALPEIEGQGYFELLDRVFKTGEPFVGREMRVSLQREPGGPMEERFLDFVYQPIFTAGGTVSGIFAHGVDITEQVRAREDAEAANRVKDEFLATLSHELRTPLTAILGWSRLLAAGQLNEEGAKRALETIERNAKAQSQLIEDVLDVSRIISGKLRLDVQPVELAAVIQASLDSVRLAAEAKEITLQPVLDSRASLVSGDSARLQQVVWNLLSNAIKFTPKGGRVQVSLARINAHVEITVSDTGCGISPDLLPHVFERFRQADSSTTRTHAGLGLGLAIVRHLVELHGGTVGVESEGEGRGATFRVQLPLMSPQVPALSEQKESARMQGGGGVGRFNCPPELVGLRVLLVDDEEDTRVLISELLEKCGASVRAVGSAAEALGEVERIRPDVLISDIGMPQEDGYSLIRKVRALPPERGGQTPAAALTAYARLEDRMRVLRSGFQIHVPKPVEPLELVTVVANLAGRIGKD